jgi:hypothetical protein
MVFDALQRHFKNVTYANSVIQAIYKKYTEIQLLSVSIGFPVWYSGTHGGNPEKLFLMGKGLKRIRPPPPNYGVITM